MNIIKVESSSVLSFGMLYTQSDCGSETIRSSFQTQESSTGLKLGWKVGGSNNVTVCDCELAVSDRSFALYPHTLPPKGSFYVNPMLPLPPLLLPEMTQADHEQFTV